MRRFILSLLFLPIAATAQQSAPAASSAAPATKSRIARIVVLPLRRVVNAGETLQLSAEARDAAGNVIEGVSFRFAQTGAPFEGALSSSGLVTAGATGVMPAAVVAMRPGEQPVVERFEVRMVPGPAARIALSPEVARLVPGQRIRLEAQVQSALGDRRDDRVQWASSNPRVLTVNEVGLVTAIAAGRPA
jgi:hypothetical protein